ncbi:MAG: hypothetical protein ACRC0L_00695 [Angustibacter sp.]
MVDIVIRDIPEKAFEAIEAAAAERGLEPGEFMRQEMEKNLKNEQQVFTPLSFMKLEELAALPPPEPRDAVGEVPQGAQPVPESQPNSSTVASGESRTTEGADTEPTQGGEGRESASG